MDAVERPDRDGPRLPLELRRRVRDLHGSACASRADARAAFASRSRVARRSRSASASASVSPMRPSASSSASTTLGVGLADGERPDLRSPQRGAVAAERIGDRAHVRPGADMEVECRDAVRIRDDVERVDPRPAHGHLDHHAPPVQAVGALAPDLDGRRRRDRELDLTAEALERGLELGVGREARAARAARPPGRPSSCAGRGRRRRGSASAARRNMTPS